MAAPRLAFDTAPTDWKVLQVQVAQFFREMGCEAQIEASMPLPRGAVTVDVIVRDPVISPPAVCVVECKHWRRAVPKTVVHAFRTVMVETGADRGFIVSTTGFQSGARAAAASTNIQLVSWRELQALYFDRWLATTTSSFHSMAHHIGMLLGRPEDDAFTDNRIWRNRECSEEAWKELEALDKRYAAITTWALVTEGVPIEQYLTFPFEVGLPGSPRAMNTYRRLVDWFPVSYADAEQALRRFSTDEDNNPETAVRKQAKETSRGLTLV